MFFGKKDLENCEDNIFFGNNYAAIIDGATSSGHIKIENKKGEKLESSFILYLEKYQYD